MDQNNPTILIKKSDGTFQRVSISEFEEIKKQQELKNKPQEPARRVEEVPVVAKKSEEAVKPVVVPEQQPEQRTVLAKVEVAKEDLGSLLDEPTPEISSTLPLTSVKREQQVEEILKSLSFKISSGNSSRLRTTVLLFLKDVRGEEDTKEILLRREIDGGVGLNQAQTDELINKCKQKLDLEVKKIVKEEIRPIKLNSAFQVPVSEAARLERELPSVVKKSEITNTTPNNFFKHKPKDVSIEKVEKNVKENVIKQEEVLAKPVPNISSKEILDKQTTKITLSELPVEFKIKKDPVKPTMHDVKSAPLELGPVDEIRYFSLVDFRRLGGPVDAAKRFKQKLLNLKEESVLLYLEGVEAWHESPLFHDYIGLLGEALKSKLPLNRVTTDKNRIQPNEMLAIIQMEKELG